MLTNATATTYMRLRPPRRIVRRINQRVKRLYLPFRVWRHDRRSRDRQIRVIRVYQHNISISNLSKLCSRALLTGMFARCLGNPSKFKLRSRKKRTERMRIE